MYNGVTGTKIKEKYDKVFELIGKRVGLSKLTYKDYMGLRDSDTRKNKFRDALEDELKNRKSADVCACIDAINKDVESEDEIDKIDSFFKLGEKLYPKKEEKKEEVVTPAPDELFKVEEDEIKDENKKNKLNEKVSVTTEIAKALKKAGIVIVGALDFISITLLAGAITTGILSGGLTFGTVALFSALPAATLAVIYRNIRKHKKKKISRKKTNTKNSETEIESNEETKEEIKKNVKPETEEKITSAEETNDENFDFSEDIKGEENAEEKLDSEVPPEVDSEEPVSKPEDEVEEFAGGTPIPEEKPDSEVEDPAREMPKVEPTDKKQNNEQVSSWMNTMKPNFWVDGNNQQVIESTENSNDKSSLIDTMKPNFEVKENNSGEQVSNNISNNTINDRKSKTISEAKDIMLKINSKIENNKEFIIKADHELKDLKKEIESNKYEKSSYIADLERDYNRLKEERDNAFKEMKRIQEEAHSLNESLEKLKNKTTPVAPVPRVVEHKVGEDKKIYIVNKPDSRVIENIDYTDKMENSRKK